MTVGEARLILDPALRPWNIGIFSGLPLDGNLPKLQYFIDNPDVPVPQGEPYNTFFKRWSGTFRYYLGKVNAEQESIALITSARNLFLVPALLGLEPVAAGQDDTHVDWLPGTVLCVDPADWENPLEVGVLGG